MNERELLGIIDHEESRAVHYSWGELAQQRENAIGYYLQQAFDGDKDLANDGRSTYVTSEVYDVVEGALPSLLKIFLGSDKVVEFQPVGPEDEGAAEQATEACEYVFNKMNSPLHVCYTTLKDGLLSKTGAVRWYYDEKVDTEETTYENLADQELLMLLLNQDGSPKRGVEVVEHTQREDGAHDVKLKVTKDQSKICVIPIPPEELVVSEKHNSMLLDDCPFIAHICEKTRSELLSMGYSDADLEEADADPDWVELSPERDARRALEGGNQTYRQESVDPALKTYWVSSIWMLVDWDEDGIAERRYVVKIGNKIVYNEPTDHVPIAAWSPCVIPHRFYGISFADKAMDLQYLTSTLFRSVLDNLYLSNDAQLIVSASQDGSLGANVDDLLHRRPGGIIREYTPNAIRPVEIPFFAQHTLPWLEYSQAMKENRIGVTRYNQGLDAESLNKTATGISMIQGASNQRLELVARLYAEFLMKPMFKGILRLLSQNYNSTKPLVTRLRNQWVEFDPSNWSTGMDVTVNVGIGTGDKREQLVHLNSIANWQVGLMKMGLPIPYENVRATMAKMAENAGFKETDQFWPEQLQPQQQQDPRAAMAQQQMQLEAAKLQQDAQKSQVELQMDARKAQQDAALEKYKADLQAQTQIAIAQMRGELDQRMKIADLGNSLKMKQAERFGAEPQMDEESGEIMDPLGEIKQALASLVQMVQQAQAPKAKRILRDRMGRVEAIETEDFSERVIRDQSGRIIGTQPLQ